MYHVISKRKMKQEEQKNGKERSNSNEGKSLIREENNYLIWLRSSNTVLIRERHYKEGQVL